MGVVYKARQIGLNRSVALKMVLSGDQADPRELVRFLAEAEAVAAVRHPNVVQVYGYGEHDGRPFLAMEYLDGGSLADILLGIRQARHLATRPRWSSGWPRRSRPPTTSASSTAT